MMINHPNIVKLQEVLASKTKIYLIFDYIEGGELFEKLSLFVDFSMLFRGSRKNRRKQNETLFSINNPCSFILQSQKYST